MRSRADRGRGGIGGVVVVAAALVSLAAAPAQRERSASDRRPGPVEVARALEKVKADPNLATERTIKTLQWKDAATQKRSSATPAWLEWITGLFRWIEQSARLLVWCAAIVLAGMLAVYISRLVRAQKALHDADPFVAPTHVRDLDIRPESLPPDIGAAARALWDRGEHRAALALLYRGLLSRLAHVHRIPIRDSSTEGDCLALASGRLPPGRLDYTSGLIRVWQRSVYGREDVQATTVYSLCDRFAPELDPSPLAPTARGGAA